MKTMVLKLKKGREKQTGIGWKRIELVPGFHDFAFADGELIFFGLTKDIMMEIGNDDDEDNYSMSFEEAEWL